MNTFGRACVYCHNLCRPVEEDVNECVNFVQDELDEVAEDIKKMEQENET